MEPQVAMSVNPRKPEGAVALENLQRRFVEQIFNVAADASSAALKASM